MKTILHILSFLTGPMLSIEVREPYAQHQNGFNSIFERHAQQDQHQREQLNQLFGNQHGNRLVNKVMPEDISLLADPEQAFANAPEELQNFCKLVMLNPIPEHILPKGFILYGPPGTGKTELAKVLVKQTGFAFYNLSGGQVGSALINETANNIKKMFNQIHQEINANDALPGAILFIDEIEALAPTRDSLHTHQEDTKVVTTLLQEIEGMFSHKKPVIVIGATNVTNKVDSALKSRLKMLPMPYPTQSERLSALQHLAPTFFKGVEPMPSEWIAYIAQHSQGLSYRDLVGITKEAATRRYLNQTLDLDILKQLIQKRYNNNRI